MHLAKVVFLTCSLLFCANSVQRHQGMSLSLVAAETNPDKSAVGRMTVTVQADNETEAIARAEKSHRGWKAGSAKKSSKDPKSRTWSVAMTKD